MRFFRDLPIRRKLAVIGIVTTFTALLLACGAFVGYEQIRFRRTMARDLSITAQMIAFNSAAALSFNDINSAEQTLKALAAQPHIMAACVYDGQGRVFAVFQREGSAAPNWPPPRNNGEEFDRVSLRLFHSITLADETIGTIYLQSDLEEISARWERYAVIVGTVMGTAILVAFLVGSRLQRMISEPISLLAHAIAGVSTSENRYSVRAVKKSNDELGSLVDGFNNMLLQIQAREADLGKARAELETRVEERTRELVVQIAERQRTEEERDRFFTLSLDLLCIAGFDGYMRRTNPAFGTLLGFSAEELLHLEYVDLIHPDDRDATRIEIEKLAAGNTLLNFEIRVRCADGSYRWFAWSAKGAPEGVCFYAYGRDITERKRSEVELREKSALLEAQLDSTIDGILVVDGNGRKLYQNQRMVDVWKIPQEIADDPDDQKELQFVASQAEDPERFVSIVRELYSHRDRTSRDEITTITGTIFDRYSAPVLGKDGKYYGRIWGFRDITERKHAEVERETLHRQLLATSRQAGMAEVATSVLHNVGNVLNSVNVSATLVGDRMHHSKARFLPKIAALLQAHTADLGVFLTTDLKGRQIPLYLATLGDELLAEQVAMTEELGHLRKNVEHIKQIVGMQQSFAKVSGLAESLPLIELLNDALRITTSTLSRQQIEIVRDYQFQPTLTIDRHKLMQILVNLIRNSIHACDDAVQPNKKIILSMTRHEQRVRIAIIDNGVGIPPDNLTRIFAHGFTTRKEGHGFGLHSCALVAKELGGSLAAYSGGLGLGATFTVELPFEPELPVSLAGQHVQAAIEVAGS